MDVIWPKPGKYVVAVSGGIDSVVLLDILAKKGEYELVVAHADHGVRGDSAADAAFVEELAASYKLNKVITKLNFSKKPSENVMRQARYDFLFKVMQEYNATGVVVAHHKDDVLETSILNVHRGTDRYGAAGGMNRKGIIRPLMHMTKKQIIEYAKTHDLSWREDSTNIDTTYTRNNIRHNVVPTINRAEYENHLSEVQNLNSQIDVLLKGRMSINANGIHISKTFIKSASLREVEVALAYALRHIQPDLELNQRRIAQVTREIMLGTDKISFSTGAAAGIIIDIQ